MLDVARHFHTKAFIKRYIDLLAFYKMNRLHLHLTDGQAWTLEILRYPRLGDRRKIPPHSNPARGIYSQKDIREIVRYAASRHVMIIPEIEFPCHSDAILACYPELMCVNHPARTGGNGHKEYCPGRDDVYDFIKNVLTEVAALFDAPFIHIGGDEYFGTAWANCPDCQKRIKREKLEAGDSPELKALFKNCQGSPRKYLLYRYMMRRIAKQVVALNRIPVLWDDLAWRGEFPEKSVLIQWHYKGLFDWMQQVDSPDDPVNEATAAEHSIITAPASHLYFDYFNGGKLIQRVYEFEPVPRGLKADQAKYVLGPQACMWEHGQEKIDGMLFPRLIALAEQAWTPKRLRKWAQFSARLEQHFPRLKILGVKYTKPSTTPKRGEIRSVGMWDIPKMEGGFKEWLINDVVTGTGRYELKLKLTGGRGANPDIQVFWTDDGHQMPVESIKTAGLQRVYRFTVSSNKLQGLYSVRLYLKGDGRTDSSGEGFLKRMH